MRIVSYIFNIKFFNTVYRYSNNTLIKKVGIMDIKLEFFNSLKEAIENTYVSQEKKIKKVKEDY